MAHGAEMGGGSGAATPPPLAPMEESNGGGAGWRNEKFKVQSSKFIRRRWRGAEIKRAKSREIPFAGEGVDAQRTG